MPNGPYVLRSLPNLFDNHLERRKTSETPNRRSSQKTSSTAGCVDIDPHTPCMHDRSRVAFLAEPSVRIMRYGSITLKSAVGTSVNKARERAEAAKSPGPVGLELT
jgi:hypothetical protein